MNPSSRLRVLRLPALLVLGALVGCSDIEIDLIPDGGYDKLAYRVRTGIAEAAAPAPPPLVAGLGAGGGAATPLLSATSAPAGVTQEMVEQGQQQFGTVCTACHGAGGTGSQVGPALTDQNWLNISGSYDEIVNVIRTGVATPQQFPGAMPPMGGGSFNDEQIRQLGAYVYALSHAEGS